MADVQKVMTAARAKIKKDGKIIGLMRNLRVSENFQRASVQGIGRVTKSEIPLVGFTGTWNADFYVVDLQETGIPDLDNRNVSSVEQYKNTKLLLEEPVDVVIYKTTAQTIENGVVTATEDVTFAVLRNVYLNSMSFDITENQVSGKSISGEYTEPIILPQ